MRRLGWRFTGSRPARAALASFVAGWASGCFVTIADPAAPASGGAPNADSGGGGAGGEAPGNGGIGTGGGRPTDAGDEGSSGTCASCALANVRVYGCDAGACTIAECADGFVDCDGDAANGCETDFRVQERDAEVAAIAPKFGSGSVAKIDGTFSEWIGFPLFPMKKACDLCQPSQPGGQPGQPILGEIPSADDLTAAFAAGWDSGGLYVYAQVRDDWIGALDSEVVEKQDGIELLTDGDLNDVDHNYSPDVHHLFVGALAPPGKNVSETNQLLQANDATVAAKVEHQCYFVEMRLSWSYVMGRSSYSPKAGDLHGFSIATNDWDLPRGAEAGASAARETQWFSVVPNVNYTFDTTGFGTVTLE